jgi:tetratricopeptide (TPR) repeat protein
VAKSFEHLSDAQLEHYGTKSFTVTPEEEQKIEAHLEDCANCRSRVLENQRVRFGLLASSSIKSGSRVAPGFLERGSVHPVAVEPSSVQGLSSEDGTPGQPVPADWDPYKPASTACIAPDGPSEDDLRNLAAGIIVQERAMAITQHAVECPHCASILRLFIEDFSDDLTAPDLAEELAAEKDFLSQLKSSTPEWQKEIAALAMQANRGANATSTSGVNAPPTSIANPSSTFGANPSPTSGATIFGWPIRRVLVPAAIAASALLAFGLWFTQRDTPEKVEKLLAQAYTEQRTMEYRWPGAEWGPVRVTRGSGQSALSRPTSQLEAETILAEHQASNSAGTSAATFKDPKWLTARAEAELLDNQPQLAITDLTQALSANPGSSDIELMLAIAHAQQGDATDDTTSRRKALELLNKVISQKTPPDPVTLFNRALVYQRLNIPERANADWEELLRTEPKGAWADQARTKFSLPGHQ